MTHATIGAARRLSRPHRELLLLAVIAVALPFFFMDGPSWLASETGRALSNLLHIPFFSLVTALIHSRFPLHSLPRWLIATAAILLVSLVIELIQTQVGRSASWHDVLRNLIGTWLVIFWIQRPRPLVWSGRVLASAALTAEVVVLIAVVVSQQRLAGQLPEIASLEDPAEIERWERVNSRLALSDEIASNGSFALKGQLSTAVYSGMSLDRLPHDWSGYRRLAFDLYNPQAQDLSMTLRIHDAPHEFAEHRWQHSDRFNYSIVVKPGWNHYSIPLDRIESAPRSRKMDLTLIRNLTLFAVRLDEPKVVYADNFRLEE